MKFVYTIIVNVHIVMYLCFLLVTNALTAMGVTPDTWSSEKLFIPLQLAARERRLWSETALHVTLT